MDCINITNAARNHDGLVIAVANAIDGLFKYAEIATQNRASEFVIECGATERAFDHDLQWRSNAFRLAVLRRFPRQVRCGDV